MSFDAALFAITAAIWAALAVAYATVPMFAMPGATPLWGGGAALFALIALLMHRVR